MADDETVTTGAGDASSSLIPSSSGASTPRSSNASGATTPRSSTASDAPPAPDDSVASGTALSAAEEADAAAADAADLRAEMAALQGRLARAEARASAARARLAPPDGKEAAAAPPDGKDPADGGAAAPPPRRETMLHTEVNNNGEHLPEAPPLGDKEQKRTRDEHAAHVATLVAAALAHRRRGAYKAAADARQEAMVYARNVARVNAQDLLHETVTVEWARDALGAGIVNYVGEAVGEYNDRGRRALKRGKLGDYREACQYRAAFWETVKKLAKETRDVPKDVFAAWEQFGSQELSFALFNLGRGELMNHKASRRRPGAEKGPVGADAACSTLKAALDLDPGLTGPYRARALGDLAAALDLRGAPRAAVLAARDGQVAAMSCPDEAVPAGVFDRAKRGAPPPGWTDADARVAALADAARLAGELVAPGVFLYALVRLMIDHAGGPRGRGGPRERRRPRGDGAARESGGGACRRPRGAGARRRARRGRGAPRRRRRRVAAAGSAGGRGARPRRGRGRGRRRGRGARGGAVVRGAPGQCGSGRGRGHRGGPGRAVGRQGRAEGAGGAELDQPVTTHDIRFPRRRRAFCGAPSPARSGRPRPCSRSCTASRPSRCGRTPRKRPICSRALGAPPAAPRRSTRASVATDR